MWHRHGFPFRKICISLSPTEPASFRTVLLFTYFWCKVMKKSQKLRRKEVENLLRKQKIRSVEEIEAYKLSVCHPASAGIDLGSRP
jgi:hypothetical protein